MTIYFDLTSLRHEHMKKIVFQALSGSQAYGLARSHSDEDIRGIFILPSKAYLSITEPTKMVSDERGNIVYYSLRRVMELISQSNPNIIELLFTPSDCIQMKSPLIESLLSARHEFVSMELCDSFIGFAQTQLKKARGQNKWINKPQATTSPKKEDFVWLVPYNNSNNFPARPIPLHSLGIDLTQCHVSSLEHCPNVYRLYQIGVHAKGVFRNETLVCESISENEEKNNFLGLLIFNKFGFDVANRDFQHYWQWRNNRNEQRWKLQDDKIIDYDPKNMMHMFRLLLSGENILQKGEPLVKVEAEKKQFLDNILDGKFSFEELTDISNAKIEELNKLKEHVLLPLKPDMNLINKLLYSITQEWEDSHA